MDFRVESHADLHADMCVEFSFLGHERRSVVPGVSLAAEREGKMFEVGHNKLREVMTADVSLKLNK